LQKKHGLKDIYDAAHAFGVEQNKHSILNHGDLSILSFHATKVFNTIKGGAIISHTAEMEHHIANLKNFGFRGELVVEEPGINAKMNELQAAYGLLQLNTIDAAILECKAIADEYRKGLKDVPGIRILEDLPETKHNYAYFPILVDDKKYSHDRDALYEMLKRNIGQ
jgi:dTDP-4-amino-4,6-dideoxygalactose transaminase